MISVCFGKTTWASNGRTNQELSIQGPETCVAAVPAWHDGS